MKRVCFIYRKHADTPSIERVFRVISNEFEKKGVEVVNATLPFGNSLFGVLGNLLFFRPPPADILHITGHVHYIALLLPPRKTVLTVHDLGILRSRAGLRQRIIKKLFFDWPFKRVRFLAAISEATKRCMVEFTKCDPEKITVINDPIDPKMKRHRRHFNSAKPVILHIGTAPHKNLDRLLDAVEGITCKLLIVGRLNESQLENLKRRNIEFESLKAQTDEEMQAIYGRCDLVVFCSTFEGFGLPIVEGQSMGIPVITSDVAPMNDVAGSGAIKVDPLDPAQIRRAIETVRDDSEIRNNIISAGQANIARFDSAKIAGQYIDLYQRIESNTKPQ